MKGPCPTHGLQEFIRDELRAWWSCALRDDEVVTCDLVIPDELVTADGADPVRSDGARFTRVTSPGESRHQPDCAAYRANGSPLCRCVTPPGE